MKRLLILLLLLACPALARARTETVTFRYEGNPATGSVFVSGSLPELGSGDLARSILMIRTGDAVWELDVALPVNRTYDYQFYSRQPNPTQMADSSHGTALTAPVTASTAAVTLDPATKSLAWRGSLTNPTLHWRQAADDPWVTLPLSPDGTWWSAGPFAEANRPLDFYLTGDGATREPAALGGDPADDPFFTTGADTVHVQDGSLFAYEPAATLSPPRRDYDPAAPPVIASTFMGQNRRYRVFLPRGYDEQPDRYYPVIYFQDGQGLVDPDTTVFGNPANPQPALDPDGAGLSGAIAAGRMHEVIVVGIDTQDFGERLQEPYLNNGLPGYYRTYADFLRFELMPEINQRYRTLAGPENTATAGYEFGASVALYLSWDYPNSFGKAGLINVNTWNGLFANVTSDTKRNLRLYLDSGDIVYSSAVTLRELLLGHSGSRFAAGGDLHYYHARGQTRSVPNFGSRVPGMLSSLFPAAEVQASTAAGAANPYWLSFFGLTTADWKVDLDGDGWTTRDEYAFGTSPINGDSRPVYDVKITGQEAAFSFSSQPGAVYKVQDSTDLSTWLDFGDPVAGTGGDFSATVPLAPTDPDYTSRRFFRLIAAAPGDADLDGLSDIEEATLLGTRTDSRDTDRDGFDDGDEVLFLGTDPLVPNRTGGSISGRVILDANGDSLLSGDDPIPAATVFLDLDYDRIRDEDEPTRTTDATGAYQFTGIAPGSYHVVQEVPAGSVQTYPGRLPGQPDGLPDTLVSYEHVPYAAATTPSGKLAADDHGIPVLMFPPPAVPVDPALLLKPIGDRNLAFSAGYYNTTEFVSVTRDTVLTVSFDDEEIIDGPGYDFQVVSVNGVQDAGEKVEVSVGGSLDSLTYLGVAGEEGDIGFDLSRYGISTPVRYIRLKSLNNAGALPGFELVGFRAIHFAAKATDVHYVDVSPGEDVTGIDFGRIGRDLVPRVYLSNESGTPDAGGTVSVHVTGADDFGTPALSLTANGTAIPLDAAGRAEVPATWPGELVLTASATDSAGQTGTQVLTVTVRNADGSLPNIPDSPSLTTGAAGAPDIRIHSPGAGAAADTDTPVVASIAHPGLTSWQLHYAPVSAINPYDLAADDPDYQLLGSGSAPVINSPLGTFPGATLPDGIYFLRVSASAGAVTGYSGHVIAVRTDTSALYPQITISTPAEDATVAGLSALTGSITSSSPVREWYVEYADLTGVNLENLADTSRANLTRIAGGTGSQPAGSTLATFDPTVLANGSYFLKVTAWNDFGLGWTRGVTVNVSGENKPGRLRLEFDDLSIDLAGIPIRIRRIYDSLGAGKSGDFGYGWSLAFADPDIRDTDPDNGAPFSLNGWKEGTRLYLNAPDGRRIGYTFHAEQASSGLVGTYYRAVFLPDPGVYDTLSVPEGDAGFLNLRSDGSVVQGFIGLPWNPDVFTLTTPQGDRYTYSETEGLLDVKDRFGNALIHTGDGFRHSSGATVAFTRDTAGRITGVTGPDGLTWTYAYSPGGELLSVTDPGGLQTSFTYLSDPGHYLETITDPLGRTGTRYEYDADGRLAAIIDESGHRSDQTWDVAGFTGTTSDWRGNVTTIRYDARGNVLREEWPNGGVVVRAYGDPANPDQETAVTDPCGFTTRYTYDARGNVTSLRPPTGQWTTATWSELNLPLTFQLPGQFVQSFTYGPQGQLLTNQMHDGTRYYTHTADGQVTSWTTLDGHQHFLRYSGPFGRLDRMESASGAASEVTYLPNGLPSVLQGNFGDLTYTWDASGRALTETDSLGNVVSFIYSGNDLATATDEMGLVRTFTWDSRGNQTQRTLNGDATAFTYDADDHMTQVTDPVGNVTGMTWNNIGSLATVTDAAGAVTTHRYDLGGNRTETVDRLGRKRTFVYNSLNKLATERWHDPADNSVIRELVYTYNPAGKLEKVTDGDVVSYYGYAAVDEVTQYGAKFPGLPRQDIFLQYVDRTRLIRESLGGQPTYHDYKRDEAGLVTRFLYNTPEAVSARVDLRRDPSRATREMRRYSSIFIDESGLISTTDLTWNHVGRMASATHKDAAGTALPVRGTLTWTHNPRGQVATATENGVTSTVSYNARGELAGVTPAGGSAQTWAFDAGGNPSGATLSAGNRLEASGDFACDWDAEGNLIQRRNTVTGEVMDLTWDYRNRLTHVDVRPSAAAAPSASVDYRYDHRDLLIARTENGVTVWTLYGDNQMPFVEFTGTATTPTAVYYYDPDTLDRYQAVWRTGKGLRWFLTDQGGSVRTVLDNTGAVVATMDYDAFGNLTASTGDTDVPGFKGLPRDPVTGFLYSRARHYDPALGRFLSEDPVGFDSGETNVYRFAGNDPLNRLDPLGTTSAIEYAQIIVETEVDATCYAAGVGKRLDKCFTGIAKAMQDPFSDIGAGYYCIQLPLPGPLHYPVPGYTALNPTPPPGGGNGGSGPTSECPGPGE